MKADDMNKCSMIAAYHQMTNARSEQWHHFAGDPLLGEIAEGNGRSTGRHDAARETRRRQTILSRSHKDQSLHYLGWRTHN